MKGSTWAPVTQECARAYPLGLLPAPAENRIHTFVFFSSTLIDGLPCLLPKNRRKGQVIRVAETLEGPPGRKQKSMVMESWGGRASMAGGLQGMKAEWKRKRKHEIGREKKGETEK